MAVKKIDVVLMNDAVELIKEEKLLEYNKGFTDGYQQAISEVNNMERVVRCKDCKQKIEGNTDNGEWYMRCRIFDIAIDTDFFCKEGKRK